MEMVEVFSHLSCLVHVEVFHQTRICLSWALLVGEPHVLVGKETFVVMMKVLLLLLNVYCTE